MAGADRLGQPVARRVRLFPTLVSIAALALLAGLVVAGGRVVQVTPAPDDTVATLPSDPEPVEPLSAPRRRGETSRTVQPEIVAPSDPGSDDFAREEPRAPLSELSLALPPKPKDPGPTLFRPVAVESAIVESMGRRVAIAGTVSIAADEQCQTGGRTWPCGVNARTAFRLFLRGRALACDIPPKAGDDIVASCRLGKQDVGVWLVINGWARASPGGPYAEAQQSAERGKKGIFGAPPERSGVQPPPATDPSTPPADQPVLAE